MELNFLSSQFSSDQNNIWDVWREKVTQSICSATVTQRSSFSFCFSPLKMSTYLGRSPGRGSRANTPTSKGKRAHQHARSRPAFNTAHFTYQSITAKCYLAAFSSRLWPGDLILQ